MKHIILCSMLVLFSSSVIAANWFKIDDFVGDGRNVFVDVDDIKKSKDRAMMWTLSNYESPRKISNVEHLSTTELIEYDCKNKQYRTLAYYWHTERDAKGEVFYEDLAPGKMRPVLEKSNEKEGWKIACAQK